jgi:hypothetical protein
MNYLDRVPETVPEGQVVVHNRVRPTLRLGSRGFRAWLADAGDERHERCGCDWTHGRLSEHFRVKS